MGTPSVVDILVPCIPRKIQVIVEFRVEHSDTALIFMSLTLNLRAHPFDRWFDSLIMCSSARSRSGHSFSAVQICHPPTSWTLDPLSHQELFMVSNLICQKPIVTIPSDLFRDFAITDSRSASHN